MGLIYLLLADPVRIAPLGFNTDVVILALLRKSTLLEPARPQAKSFSALPQHMVRRLSAAALVANAQLLHTWEDGLQGEAAQNDPRLPDVELMPSSE
jgi:hypothetical protein